MIIKIYAFNYAQAETSRFSVFPQSNRVPPRLSAFVSMQPQQPQCSRRSLNVTAATPRRVRRKLLRGTQRPNTIPASSEGALSKKSHFGWSVNRRQECTKSSEHGPVILSYGIKKVPWEGLTQEHLLFAYSLLVAFSAMSSFIASRDRERGETLT